MVPSLRKSLHTRRASNLPTAAYVGGGKAGVDVAMVGEGSVWERETVRSRIPPKQGGVPLAGQRHVRVSPPPKQAGVPLAGLRRALGGRERTYLGYREPRWCQSPQQAYYLVERSALGGTGSTPPPNTSPHFNPPFLRK